MLLLLIVMVLVDQFASVCRMNVVLNIKQVRIKSIRLCHSNAFIAV